MLKVLLIVLLIMVALSAIVTLVERFKTFFIILAILVVVGFVLYLVLKRRKRSPAKKIPRQFPASSSTPDYVPHKVMKPNTTADRITASRAEISRGNISIISDEEMHFFLKHYYKADEIKTKVKGVSFRNDDGTDRQNILAHCHAGDQLRFEKYEYLGAPAYAVHCDWGQIGNLSADLAEEIAAREMPCIILGEILNVTGGYHGELFGCNIRVNIYEKY